MLFCALALPAATNAADARVARIGFAGRLGDALTQSARQGAELAVMEANRHADQDKDKDKDAIRFELLPQDDHGNANMAGHVAAYFVKSRVSGVIGHWSSDAAFAVAQTYEQAGIAQVNFTSTSSELTRRGYKSLFRTVGSTSDVGTTLADAAVDELRGQRIVIIGNDSSSSKSLVDAFVARLIARSRTAQQTNAVGATTSDFNAVLKSAMDMRADVIFFSAYVGQVPAFLAGVKRMNVKARILLNTGATNLDVAALDNGNLYAIEADIPNEKCPAWKAFNQRFQATYGAPPSSYSRAAYNATGALIQAVRHANSPAAATVATAMRGIRYTGLSGDISFDNAGNRVDPPYTLYHAEGASWMPMRVFSAEKNGAARCPRS